MKLKLIEKQQDVSTVQTLSFELLETWN